MIRVKTLPLAITVVAVMFGGVALSKAIGYWNTSSSKEPVEFKTGELAGLPNPADIRGSYTWLDLERAFGVPALESARAFSTLDRALDPAERVSVLEELYLPILPPGLEIGTGAVRLFVSLYTGLPLEAEEGSVLPVGAIDLLSRRPGMNAEALSRYAIPDAAPAAQSGTGSSQASERTIVGKTTFGDLYDWGLTEDQVAAAIGYAPGARTQSVRDSATANEKEFSELKATLQAMIDALP